MSPPVLVVPPSEWPVTLEEAKRHLRVTHDDEDVLVQGLIDAATSHLDGWGGILGRALLRQTWRQDFHSFHERLWLRLRPVQSVEAVSYRAGDGSEATVPAENHMLRTSAHAAEVLIRPGYTLPELSRDHVEPVGITYTAGHASPDQVPAAIRHAILLHIGSLYQHREQTAENWEPTRAYEALIEPWRRVA